LRNVDRLKRTSLILSGLVFLTALTALAGWVSLTPFGTGLFAVTLVTVFVTLAWWTNLYGHDITERKKAQLEIERVKSLLDTLLTRAPIGFAYFDRELRYVMINGRLAEINGLPAAAHIGKHVSEIVPSVVPVIIAVTNEILATGQPVRNHEFAGETLAAPGVTRYWSESWYPVHDDAGAIVGFGAVVEEITERKRSEAAIRESESRLRLFIEHAPAAIAMFDNKMRYLGASRRWTEDYQILGNILGRSHYEVFPDIPECWKEVHRRCLAGEVLSAEEDPFRRADGSVQWLKWETRPWHGPNGLVGGILIAAEDVTNRVKAQAALAEREAVLRAVTTAARVGLVMVSESRRYLFANQTYADILGLPSADIIGQRVADVLATMYDQIGPRFDRAFAGERVKYELRMPAHPQSGEVRFYEVVYEPRIKQVTEPYVVVVIVDITERKKIQQTLERQVAERTAKLSETVGELEAFSYSIAHDMRAPLRAMHGFSRILEDEYSDQIAGNGKDYLRRITASANRLDSLIQDVLNYSKIVRAELTLERVDLEPFIHGITESYPNLRAHDAEIRVEGPLPAVMANPAALTQVVSNLLGNAVKFVKPGVKPQVRVRAEKTGDRAVRLWFEDNGIGIRREVQERIFLMFQRLNPPGDYEGTGIGLTIVRKAVERMGGKVGVLSHPGQGSQFWIELKGGD